MPDKAAVADPMTRRPARAQEAYKKAGVDIAAADSWLARMRAAIRSTHGPQVLADRGAFAGLFRFDAKAFRDPVLVASTDGVGTKLKIARQLNHHDGIGIDCVAMNANDVLVCGAAPLFFLDYLAVGKIRPTIMSRLVLGVVEGCKQSGCALIGGETAEMPGVYGEDEYDIAGFCVGVVDRKKIIDGGRVKAGDVIVGLASSGVHSNGFSLVRRVFPQDELRKWKRELLAPTRIYVRPVLRALSRMPIAAISHVTGGGLARRIPSLAASKPGLVAELQPGSWPVPEIFRRIQAAGSLSDADMRGTFNMGIGLALVCPSAGVAALIRLMENAGVPAWPVGRIRKTRS